MQVIDELRDPYAVALAEATAFVAYLFAAPLWQVAAAGVLVLVARVVAGRLLPTPRPNIPPRLVLTQGQQVVAVFINQGFSDAEIARRLQKSEETVSRRVEDIRRKLGCDERWEIGDWAVAVGLAPDPQPRHWWERTIVRGTLAGAGLTSFCWTSYQILKFILDVVSGSR